MSTIARGRHVRDPRHPLVTLLLRGLATAVAAVLVVGLTAGAVLVRQLNGNITAVDISDQLGVDRDPRTNAARDDTFMTNVPGVFVAGDAGRGQSLIVWAIAEGRSAAHGVDAWLMGKPSRLPRPVNPTDRPLMA